MSNSDQTPVSRRAILQRTAAGAAAIGATALTSSSLAAGEKLQQVAEKPASHKGNINQSIVHWCFAEHWTVEETAKIAKSLGVKSIELVPPSDWPTLKKYGLTCAIASIDMAPDPPFAKGFNNPKHWPRVIKATTDAIEAAAAHGVKNVICFTGMADGISREDGAKNCVKGLKQVIGLAEKHKITLCLEMLNTRDDTHPMKGHPGYQGNDTEYCIDICKAVGSKYMKLLFDIYHVQIQNGDVIRRLKQHKEYIGHVHTAGNPGRAEIDDTQEIFYPPIMQTLIDIGYKGFVGQEFIPTRDPLVGLTNAVRLCDV